MQDKLFRVQALWAALSKALDKSGKKCPHCVKTVIHNLANTVCNFEPSVEYKG